MRRANNSAFLTQGCVAEDVAATQPEPMCDARIARAALARWALPDDVCIRLINISENTTWLIEDDQGQRLILRLHRKGYHCLAAIESELQWMQALSEQTCIVTPRPVPGLDAQTVQIVHDDVHTAERYLVMFEYIDGTEPQFGQGHEALFESLGELAAQAHLHATTWRAPAGFERMLWDMDSVFGPDPAWGDWRAAPHMNSEAKVLLEEVQARVIQRLRAYGSTPDRYGLIHADMRLANLLVHQGEIRLIDFDDCGHGWFLYDFAAAISFMEENPQVPALKAAWLRGYRRFRELDRAHEAEMDTFILLRRLALCGWMGTHTEVEIVQELRGDFVSNTVAMGRQWLKTKAARTPQKPA